tara:strand:+ start:40382 stop:40648 length:267 start_codon:yes stop_codon:yes gene_type:complete
MTHRRWRLRKAGSICWRPKRNGRRNLVPRNWCLRRLSMPRPASTSKPYLNCGRQSLRNVWRCLKKRVSRHNWRGVKFTHPSTVSLSRG